MKISDSLKESCIDLNIVSEEKFSLIKKIMDKISKEYGFTDSIKHTITEEIIAREKTMSTGMQNHVALPHCSTTSANELYAYVGICKKGTEFNSVDGSLAKIIILLVIPKAQMGAHIKTLAFIARLLNNADIRQKMIDAETPAEILSIFKNNE